VGGVRCYVLGVRWEEDVGSEEGKAGVRSQNSAVGAGPCARPDEGLISRICRDEKFFALLCSGKTEGLFPDSTEGC